MDRMSHLFAPRWSLLFCAAALLATGCTEPEADPESERQMYAQFADLAGARRSADARLRAEIDRVVDDHGTPLQLQVPPIPDEQNIAAGLVALVDADSLRSLRKLEDRLMPPDRLEFNRLELESVIQFTRQYHDLLAGIEAALQRPGCDFAIDFRHGFSAKTEFVDIVEACVYAKALEAAVPLGNGDPVDALRPLRAMFRLVELLGEVPHVSVRLSAAPLRLRAFHLVDALARHPAIRQSDLVTLYQAVQAHLDRWPSDATMWVGERAMVMHAYELIRAGRIAELLTEEELARFAREGVLQDLGPALQKSVDNDELYYLAAMRKILASCGQPYYQRQPLFDQIEAELEQIKSSPEFPVAAATLFLTDVRQGQQLQAKDRALAESWALALAIAADVKPPPLQQNPVTGRPYRVNREATRVTVWTGEPDDAQIVVPRSTPAAISARPVTDR